MTMAGLILTCMGILLGIAPPRVYGTWAGDDYRERQLRSNVHYFSSVALILVGTGLQIADTWGVGR